MACCNNNGCAACSGDDDIMELSADEHAKYASVKGLRAALEEREKQLEAKRQHLSDLKAKQDLIKREIASVEFDIKYLLVG
jgi:septal ring factor EnvC (AmiA/AmiB activator)